MNQKIIFLIRLARRISCIAIVGLLMFACEPIDSPEYFSPESPIKQGTYKVVDTGNGSVRSYVMGIRWVGGSNQIVELCNFSNGRMSAIAYLLDDNSFHIPAQKVSDEISMMEIHEGSGRFMNNTFKFIYWARNIDGREIHHEIEAKLTS